MSTTVYQENSTEEKKRNSKTKDAEDEEDDDELGEQTELFISKKPHFLRLLYYIDEKPPLTTSLFLGFQHYLTMFGSTVALPLLLAKFMCAGNNNVAKSQLICTIFFVSGISTLLQTTIGVRLPIVQGGTFSFLAPTLAILNLPKWRCPAPMSTTKERASKAHINRTVNHHESTKEICLDIFNASCWKNVCSENKTLNATFTQKRKSRGNFSDVTTPSSPPPEKEDPDDPDIWKPRMREIQGAIIVASLIQVVIGATGTMGFLMKYIGPLTLTPAISLIGLSLFDVAADSAAKHWGTSVLTIVLMVLFSQYLRSVRIPYPGYTRSRGFHVRKSRILELFPILLAVALAWLLCGIFTATNHYPRGHPARTDLRSSVLHEAPWFRVPYPGQWGTPTVSLAAVIGMFAGVMAGIVESIGDYYACARLSGAPPVPTHALNRGMLIEGIGCVLAGLFGSGSGTTSYSENIGAIGVTKVGSRRVVQIGGLFMIGLAVFGKFGALFATIPDPIIGGVFVIMFSMIAAVGLSNLQFVDLNSVRNLFILGFSIFFGLVLPKWIHHNQHVIDTGSPALDQVLFVLLDTSMWVGSIIGFILDNTLPGTDEERGIIKWREVFKSHDDDVIKVASVHTYDIPFVTSFLQRFPVVRYIPFLPYYGTEGDDVEQAGQNEAEPKANNNIENDETVL